MSYRITVEPLGQSFECAEGQNLLDAALRSGIYLPHACCHGLCATCKVLVTEGEVEHGDASPFALMDMERDEGRCLACCATPNSDLVIEADVDEDPDAQQIPLQDYVGRVADLVDLTPTIRAVYIALEGEGVLFQAGQYANLWIDGIDGPRAFSFASPPSAPQLVELNVRRVPQGKATTFIHEELRVGDPIRLSGPLGQFYVRKSDPRPLIFVAGGSGLSSPRSMILDLLLTDGDSRSITLIYGARTLEELYYHQDFIQLAKRYPNFSYVPVLSEPIDGTRWDGATGFVHTALEARFDGDFRGHKAYLCGPPPMIEAGIRTLMKGRLFERDIYTEKFVTAGDGDKALARSPLFKKI